MKKAETIKHALKLFDELPNEYIEETLIPQMQTAATVCRLMKRKENTAVKYEKYISK